jgi:hypothetical protein
MFQSMQQQRPKVQTMCAGTITIVKQMKHGLLMRTR